MNLSIDFCGVQFSNPTILASGYLGTTGASLANVVRHGAGGVTTKTLFINERAGHPNPSILSLPGGIISATGLAGEGIVKAKSELEKYHQLSDASPLILSLAGRDLKELTDIAEIANDYPVDILEFNFPASKFSKNDDYSIIYNEEKTIKAIKIIRKLVKKPISVKLSPNLLNIANLAQKLEAEGVDAITAVDAMGPGMLIDIKMRCPVLSNKVGFVSGQAIKPIALRCVWDVYKAVKIPIIASGGIVNANAAIEMLMAGASLLAIGSAIMSYDLKAFTIIQEKIQKFMKEEDFNDVKDLIGIAHKSDY